MHVVGQLGLCSILGPRLKKHFEVGNRDPMAERKGT